MESDSNCIFCTRHCPTSFTIIDGNPVKLKRESGTGQFLTNCEFGDDSNIEGHLKVILILRKILNVEEETCSKFLESFDGQLHPELWLSVCSTCDQLVSEFWEKLREIGRLERRLKGITTELRDFVQNTRAFNGNNSAGNSPVWNEIREEIMKEFSPVDDDEDDDINSSPLEAADDSIFEDVGEVDDSGSDENSTHSDPIGSEPQGNSTPTHKKKVKRIYYKCGECGDLSSNILRFKHHSQLHKLGKGVVCPDCGWYCETLSIHVANWHPDSGGRFTMEERLANKEIRLMNIVYDENPENKTILKEGEEAYEVVKRKGKASLFRCKLCPATNAKKVGIQRHLAAHKLGNGILCEECKWMVEPGKMGFHIAQIHRGKDWNKKSSKTKTKKLRYGCSECTGFYGDTKGLREHKKLHETGEGVVCEECGWLVASLRAHKGRRHPQSMKSNAMKADVEVEVESRNIVVSEKIPYYCDYCHMIFPFLSKFLLHHKSFHAKEPWLECSECESQFESKQLLKLHLGRVHGQKEEIPKEEDQPQQCQYCSEEFQSKLKKDLHISKDHQDKLLACDTCSVRFVNFGDFRKHMETTRAHANEKKFTCELCGKACTSSWELKCHRKKQHYKELGLEPHRCSHCEMVFVNKTVLDNHIRAIHTKQWKFTCEFCGKVSIVVIGCYHMRRKSIRMSALT